MNYDKIGDICYIKYKMINRNKNFWLFCNFVILWLIIFSLFFLNFRVLISQFYLWKQILVIFLFRFQEAFLLLKVLKLICVATSYIAHYENVKSNEKLLENAISKCVSNEINFPLKIIFYLLFCLFSKLYHSPVF